MHHEYITLGKNAKDLTGQQIGRLHVLGPVGRVNKSGLIVWHCRCDCGNETISRGNDLRVGRAQSCGCLSAENVGKRSTTHGMSHSLTHKSWASMLNRCTNQNSDGWEHYGDRGIAVCERWRNSFEAFYEDMGPRPSKRHTLDRIDNDGDYTPENCRWATPRQQHNNKRNNHIITFQGKTQTLAQWARETGICYATLSTRLHRGWTVEESLTRPVQRP